jgi:hypothetical protein
MPDTIVSKSATWDPKLGNFITTTTLESLSAFPTIPSGAVDVTKTIQDGVYRVSYKDLGDSTGGGGGGGGGASSYNYEAHSSVSTEPLITFGSFGPGGSWALDDDDKKKIKAAESDPTQWKTLAVSPKTGLSKYANFILSGIESFYAPSITVTITADESSVPDLSNLGKIASISNVPTLPSGGNWLFAGCNFSALQNSKWRVSREYRASGKGGWNPDLYGAG